MSKKATRAAFGEILAELGENNKSIVVLDADLAKSTKTDLFMKKFPERFFDMGIAEANMVGTAAGLALSGKKVFCASFGCFVTGRYDQIRMSVGYTRAGVTVVGTHAGIATGEDGHSQMGIEDMNLMRGIPGMNIFQPADEVETKAIVKFIVENDIGYSYLRLTRHALPDIHESDYEYKHGELDMIFSGSEKPEIAVLATGGLSHVALDAAKNHAQKTVVFNCPCIKPLDEKAVAQIPGSVKTVLTCEDHSTIGGLGSAVAELISMHKPGVKVIRHGIPDSFGESGTTAQLLEKYGFTPGRVSELIGNL